MNENLPGEEWTEFVAPDVRDDMRMHISNHGRIKSFRVNKEAGVILKNSVVNGYAAISLSRGDKRKCVKYIHKLVAQHFIDGKRDDQQFVIHKDFSKMNNFVENLAWASKKELEIHLPNNPNPRKKRENNTYNFKLTEAKVKVIKKMVADPDRTTRMKQIAKRFGISEMQLYRIKAGKNWAHVTID